MARAVSYSAHDGSDDVARFWPLYERQARRFEGIQGAEYDDLVQEAAIAAWEALAAGYIPTVTVVSWACLKYVRSLFVGGQRLVAAG